VSKQQFLLSINLLLEMLENQCFEIPLNLQLVQLNRFKRQFYMFKLMCKWIHK